MSTTDTTPFTAQEIERIATRAGLQQALADFPDDVAAAARFAYLALVSLDRPTDPAAEPWPPMRAGEDR